MEQWREELYENYLMHTKHKYIAKIKVGKNTRYFYSQKDYDAYLKAKENFRVHQYSSRAKRELDEATQKYSHEKSTIRSLPLHARDAAKNTADFLTGHKSRKALAKAERAADRYDSHGASLISQYLRNGAHDNSGARQSDRGESEAWGRYEAAERQKTARDVGAAKTKYEKTLPGRIEKAGQKASKKAKNAIESGRKKVKHIRSDMANKISSMRNSAAGSMNVGKSKIEALFRKR